jgi:NADP-reducing hydrogenase subunit HndC
MNMKLMFTIINVPQANAKPLCDMSIVEENCVGCTACARACPVGAISGERKMVHSIDQSICIKCGACEEKCKFDAVIVK